MTVPELGTLQGRVKEATGPQGQFRVAFSCQKICVGLVEEITDG